MIIQTYKVIYSTVYCTVLHKLSNIILFIFISQIITVSKSTGYPEGATGN